MKKNNITREHTLSYAIWGFCKFVFIVIVITLVMGPIVKGCESITGESEPMDAIE